MTIERVTTHLVVLSTRAFYFIKDFSIDFKWVFWTIRNYIYEFNGVVFIIYLVGG